MTQYPAPDWPNSSKEERKILYRYSSHIIAKENWAWAEFFNLALGKQAVGTDYERNFRGGRISQNNAEIIYQWICKHAPNYGQLIDEAVFQLRMEESKKSWLAFVQTHGKFSNIEVISVSKNPLSIVGYAEEEPVLDRPLKLGEHFLFRIDLPFAGTVMALQAYKEQWYALPVSGNNPVITLDAGKQIIPLDQETGKAKPLSEKTDIGQHGFAFLLADDLDFSEWLEKVKLGVPIPEAVLDDLTILLPPENETSWTLLRINIPFIP